jgi:hypothetical protein
LNRLVPYNLIRGRGRFFNVKFEDEIRAICAELVVCKSESEAVALCKRMRTLTHTHLEEARARARILPLIPKEAETGD